MSEEATEAPPLRPAWQPFTFGGVAAFAEAGWLPLLGAQLVVALLISGTVLGFVRHAYAPVILDAIQKMPETARIKQGRLGGVDAPLVSETRFLAVAVTPNVFDQIGQSADVQVQLRQEDFIVAAVFRPEWGLEFDYGPETDLDLSASHVEPWWGAWHPIIYAGIGVGALVGVFVLWTLCALVCTGPAWFIGWVTDRQLSWPGAWRLVSAGLLPGGVLLAVGIFLYGWTSMDLVGLAFVYAAHLVCGFVYLIGGILACPRLSAGIPKRNPFVS
jgi:hypothetical protein